MPMYEYVCKKCCDEFVLLQKVGTTEQDTVCPKCGSQEVKKKLSSCSCSVEKDVDWYEPPTSGAPPSNFGGPCKGCGGNLS